MNYPYLFRIRQTFDSPVVDNLAAEVERQMSRLELFRVVQPGQTVAVTAGSRGISGIDLITRGVVDHLKRLGATPFIVPAMGSHGGGTAAGQLAVLAKYGITEQSMNCPIRASMDTVELCRTDDGVPVHFDRLAYEADHTFVINRVKAHTRFDGPVESGLMKMLLIGLGNARGAMTYHRAFQNDRFSMTVMRVVEEVFQRCSVLGGLAIVENAFEQTALLDAVRPDEFATREPELLAMSKRWMARLPFDQCDMLIIDQIGKDISGTGLDSNVTGRKFDDHKATGDERPKVEIIALRGLTDATAGNANGIGMAELCRSSMLRQVDVNVTRFNAMTANHVTAAMTPLDFETDREMIDAAMRSIGLSDAANARLLWIANTLELQELECSVAYLDEVRQRDDLEIIVPPRPIPLDKHGNLPDRI